MRRRSGAVLAVVVALAAAGCGQGDEGEDVAAVRQLDVLEGIEGAGTARIEMVFEGEGSFVGVLDLAGDAASLAGQGLAAVDDEATADWPDDAVDEPLAAPPMELEMVRVGEDRWIRLWLEGDEEPPWHHRDPNATAEQTEGVFADPTTVDPVDFLDRLGEEAVSLEEVGSGEVRGEATTRYEARVAAEVLGLDGDDDGIEVADDGTVAVEIWIDDDDRLRRLASGPLSLELWDFGTPVAVEAPTDLEDEEDSGLAFLAMGTPQVVGDWAPVARGTTAGAAWTVHEAPAEVMGTATTCRTLALDGTDAVADPMLGVEGLPFPQRDGVQATCGNGSANVLTGTLVADPALAVLTLSMAQALPGDEAATPALVGFVVAPEHVGDGLVTVVRDGADPVTLELDPSGIAVWEDPAPYSVAAVEIAGGSLRCVAEERGIGYGADAPPCAPA